MDVAEQFGKNHIQSDIVASVRLHCSMFSELLNELLNESDRVLPSFEAFVISAAFHPQADHAAGWECEQNILTRQTTVSITENSCCNMSVNDSEK